MYLMRSENLSLKQAYLDVNSKRPIISPNLGFWQQMIDFEFKQFGSRSVNLLKDRGLKVPDVYLTRTRELPTS
ncbi:unnamed protein product [Enterobius vermicularis]|uniref:DSPc domain-containing protein n=1 Tax=Enterobius vermicularis TaxID=51028 RepID=A0A0N4UWF4_ENTVE|nr:unnamed protein product [Enterobius vermicularis]